MLVEIEALKVFDESEDCRKFIPPIFDALVSESGLQQESVSFNNKL